ncbi:YiaA/B family two helix domain-containing protein [Psychrobacillus insolitus]|uniref:YiaA/B family two helix domain-containing protein n=1 Tax=Psychrobacillus insolitus TaxID=1461 RepID=A0A2W7MBM3_9BACI|nr:YiaA/YiaB family inner membrane protein [Psychrobacillus insolitus]PZX02887.1 YiaA/B family two helix domain-containing protein [Psychrobacillus insolitus]
MSERRHRRRNTPAFTVLSYFTFAAGVILFSIGLYNADNLELNEKGYYIAVMMLVAVGAILTQKVIRDNSEDNDIIEEQEREFNMKVKESEMRNKPNRQDKEVI